MKLKTVCLAVLLVVGGSALFSAQTQSTSANTAPKKKKKTTASKTAIHHTPSQTPAMKAAAVKPPVAGKAPLAKAVATAKSKTRSKK